MSDRTLSHCVRTFRTSQRGVQGRTKSHRKTKNRCSVRFGSGAAEGRTGQNQVHRLHRRTGSHRPHRMKRTGSHRFATDRRNCAPILEHQRCAAGPPGPVHRLCTGEPVRTAPKCTELHRTVSIRCGCKIRFGSVRLSSGATALLIRYGVHKSLKPPAQVMSSESIQTNP